MTTLSDMPQQTAAPTINVDRSMESPAFVMPPSLCRPPVEWSLGVSPSHAAKSRPDLNVSGGGAFMLSIDDPIEPTPGIVAIRLLMSSSRCHFISLASIFS